MPTRRRDRASPDSRTNLLLNGGFEVKQRPAASFPSGWTLDGWNMALGGPATTTVSQITSTIGSKGKSMQVVHTETSDAQSELTQTFSTNSGFYRVTQLLGQTLAFAVTVKSTVVDAVRISLYSDGGTGTFAPEAGNRTTGEERLACAGLLPAGASFMLAIIRCGHTASATIELNDATLVLGGVPADYEPAPYADDLARCQQHYEYHGGAAAALQTYAPTAADTDIARCYSHAQAKAWTPTMTKVGTWTLGNVSTQPQFDSSGRDGYQLRARGVALGVAYFQTSNATDGVVAEAN